MASFNKVILLGNLTRDPEVRYTPKGSAVCDLGIAVNRVYTTDSGEKREEVTYVDVVLWARLAEIAGEISEENDFVKAGHFCLVAKSFGFCHFFRRLLLPFPEALIILAINFRIQLKFRP